MINACDESDSHDEENGCQVRLLRGEATPSHWIGRHSFNQMLLTFKGADTR